MSQCLGRRRPEADRGSVIVMVLVLMIIGSLMVLPLLDYAQVVLRQNSVLSDRTQRIEAVKGGLRTSLGNPTEVYRHCSQVGSALPTVEVNNINVSNSCSVLGAASALAADQLRFGLAATQIGEAVPEELTGDRFEATLPADDPDASTEWYAHTSLTSETDAIMYPNLPVYGTSPRSPVGSQMPSGFPECRVYFPGKYTDPIVLDGPTFFVNGVYYFTQEVRVVGGANVVVGDGNVPGCTTSQEAIFFATPPPLGSHNVNGVGSTWVLGDAARVEIDNSDSNLPISLIFNKRYAAPGDWGNLPSNDVSIMTVNGDPEQTNTAEGAPDDDGVPADHGHYLRVTGLDPTVPVSLHVPESYVGTTADDPQTTPNESETRDLTEPASSHGYVPSVFTPKLRAPEAPAAPTVEVRNHGALVSWSPPASDGGRPVTGYTVTAAGTTGASETVCKTAGTTTCGFDPIHGSSVSFSVVATNEIGDSEPSPASVSVSIPESGGAYAAPGVAMPDVTMQYDPEALASDPFFAGVAHVTWTPPTDGGLPITAYEVFLRHTPLVELDAEGRAVGLDPPAAEQSEVLCSLDPDAPQFDDMTVAYVPEGASEIWTPDLRCDFTGLNLFDRYEIGFRSTNAVGKSAPGNSDAWVWDGIAGNIDELVDVADQDDDGDPALPDADPTTPMYPDGFLTEQELTSYLSSIADPTATDRTLQPHDPANPDAAEYHAPPPPRSTSGTPPVPILEIDLPSAEPDAAVKIQIPSYIAVPMGRVRIDNPHGRDVKVSGGILAAQFDVNDSRASGPESVPIGFEEAIVQFKFLIESWTAAGGERSRAVVQINQNGAYAINSWEVQ